MERVPLEKFAKFVKEPLFINALFLTQLDFGQSLVTQIYEVFFHWMIVRFWFAFFGESELLMKLKGGQTQRMHRE